MKPAKMSAWLRKLDQECPYQVLLPRRQLSDEIMEFLTSSVGKFELYVEDDYAASLRATALRTRWTQRFSLALEPTVGAVQVGWLAHSNTSDAKPMSVAT